MKKVFGIDLGTTYSCISYIDEYGKAVVLKNSDGEHTTPSVVYMDDNGSIIVGNEAKRTIKVEPENTCAFIKRKIGKEGEKALIAGKEYDPSEVSAWILKKIVGDANDELRQTGVLNDGEEIKDVVITCPAYFGVSEREATKTAGELAGLNVLNIINEPTAAAISYGVSGNEKEETVLVYDLGGGTFDITIMHISGNNIRVVCTGGDSKLGGKDWDDKLAEYVLGRYEEELGEDISEDPEIVSELYVNVEVWKKSLTSRENVKISVNGPAGRFREDLTREKYDEITKINLDRTKNMLDSALQVAADRGYPLSKIDKILLVGGSSRMPQVSNMFESDYNIKPVLADPDEAVSKGAAIFANNEKIYNDFMKEEADKTGKTVEEVKQENMKNGDLDKKFEQSQLMGLTGLSKINITNVLSRTYGVRYIDGSTYKIQNMLMINDALPAKRTESFYTIYDNQHGISLIIYESLSTEDVINDITDMKPITEVDMRFNQQVPKGTKVEVTLTLDNSGLLHILASEKLYGNALDTTFQIRNQMSENEEKEALERIKSTKIE